MSRQPSALGDMLDEAISYAHDVLEQALDACAAAELLTPDRDEITIVRERGGAAQVDLLMPTGQLIRRWAMTRMPKPVTSRPPVTA